jgi:hypothetical protein
MGTVKTYDPAQVIVTIDGNDISGFADGTFVGVARNNDIFTLTVGADGEATRTKSNDRSGRFTFTLQQSSISNDVINAIANRDEESNQGAVAVQVKDASGNALHSAERAWVVKKPDSEYAKETSNREWILETNELIHDPAGNAEA